MYGIHHLADDGTWADDRNLHYKVIKLVWIVARKRGHLRPRLDLKQSDGVGLAKRGVYLPVVVRYLCDVYVLSIVLRNEVGAVLQDGHHAETQAGLP